MLADRGDPQSKAFPAHTYPNAGVLIGLDGACDKVVGVGEEVEGHDPRRVVMPQNLRDVHDHL